MTDKNAGAVPAEPVNSEPIYSLEELSHACDVDTAWVVELIEHGIIEARGDISTEWKFSSLSVVRLAKAKRFDRDLGVNPAGIALAFDLLAEIDRLKAHLNVLRNTHGSLAHDSGDHFDPA